MRPGGQGAAVLAVVLMLAGCDENLLNPMAFRQPKARAYEESGFFANGLAMRPPPGGTFAREWRGAGYALTTGYANPGGRPGSNGDVARAPVAAIPLPVTRALLALGQRRFEVTCAACHGLLGDGQSVVAAQMALRPPPSLHNYADRPPGFIYDVVTRGFGLMPSYATELDLEQRWAVVAYVRALQWSQQRRLTDAPPEVRAELEHEETP
jgi:mono/diheme cytochrome c family protein